MSNSPTHILFWYQKGFARSAISIPYIMGVNCQTIASLNRLSALATIPHAVLDETYVQERWKSLDYMSYMSLRMNRHGYAAL